jgi:hypothetical protein
MRCFLFVMVLLGSPAMGLQAEEKSAAKPPPDYCNVELRGTLNIGPHQGEILHPQAFESTSTAGGHKLIFGENKELAAAAKKLDGKKVLIKGHPGTWSPLTAGPPTTFIPFIRVTAIQAADVDQEAAELLKGLTVTGSLTKVIGGFGSPGRPEAGDTFEIEFDQLPREMLKLTAPGGKEATHYIPFAAPLRMVQVKQSEKAEEPRRTAIHLSAADANRKFLVQVIAESPGKGSKVRVYFYEDGGFLGSMAEGEGVLK